MNETSRRVLLVEDESGLVMTLTDLLTSEGYHVETALDGQAGLESALDGGFDLVILDVMLPGKNGFDVCRDLRQRGVQIPILMLTARGQVVDKVLGLKLGADDYLTKPFEPLELLARIEALLRRASAADSTKMPETFRFGSVVVDFRRTDVRRNGQPVELSAREFELLRYFIQHRSLTISREQLLRDVWGYGTMTVTRTVDVHVGLLRQKLEADAKDPRHFLTVRGFGYKFVDQAE
jgi:two-component system alkaline phosphatase synthesis response regulator PhoP